MIVIPWWQRTETELETLFKREFEGIGHNKARELGLGRTEG